MENKQTAVEWLWEQIDNAIPYQNIKTSQVFSELLEQAKQMEKEQHDKTSLDWFLEGKARMSNNRKWNNFEHYWEQTYGGNK
jgi:ribosomal protein S7